MITNNDNKMSELLPNDMIGEIVQRTERADLYAWSLVSVIWRRRSLKRVIKINKRKRFEKACLYGDLLSISQVEGKVGKWLDVGIQYACGGGEYRLVRVLSSYCERTIQVDKRVYFWNFGLAGACRGGYFELVQNMMERGATKLDSGFYAACRGGRQEIINIMITEMQTRSLHFDWNDGLYEACRGGHLHIVKFLIEKGAKDIDGALTEAENHGRTELADFLRANGAKIVDRIGWLD